MLKNQLNTSVVLRGPGQNSTTVVYSWPPAVKPLHEPFDCAYIIFNVEPTRLCFRPKRRSFNLSSWDVFCESGGGGRFLFVSRRRDTEVTSLIVSIGLTPVHLPPLSSSCSRPPLLRRTFLLVSTLFFLFGTFLLCLLLIALYRALTWQWLMSKMGYVGQVCVALKPL